MRVETLLFSPWLRCFNSGSKILVLGIGRNITYESWICHLIIVMCNYLCAQGSDVTDNEPNVLFHVILIKMYTHCVGIFGYTGDPT